ncbi:MAG TPA: acyl-CoA reductase [Clostridia bacterium]|nr:acyl-CoA reductase [Clostridia bacterium]
MNLVDGKIISSGECDAVLDELDQRILRTFQKGRLDPETVISACDRLVSNLDEAQYLKKMAGIGIDEALGKSYLDEARRMFSEDSLRYRLSVELGEDYSRPNTFTPSFRNYAVKERTFPLGVLLHIAAGNADGLPAFSVLEGLLTGNINILKLPAAEGGISVQILLELIKAEPSLAEYIYVFDYSSKDIVHIKKLISVTDAVVVWGGKEAVSALRCLVPPNVRLMEWGHKASFAYITEQGITESGLLGLAKNITQTGQLLCSSLQGFFIDTDNMNLVCDFCGRFLPVLEDAVRKSPQKIGIGIRSQVALKLYNEELDELYRNSKVFRGVNCSLTAYPDTILETSIPFGNPWVRPLPRSKLLSALRPYKNYLQTVGLLCSAAELEDLSEILFQAGAVRVCRGENMSDTYCGAPHDGEYSLRRYTKIVSLEN